MVESSTENTNNLEPEVLYTHKAAPEQKEDTNNSSAKPGRRLVWDGSRILDRNLEKVI